MAGSVDELEIQRQMLPHQYIQALGKADGMHRSFEDENGYWDATHLEKTTSVDKERKSSSVSMVLMPNEV
jgi:hypothetical protein